MAARDRPAKWTPLADEMLLADELVERPRPHPGGQRLSLRRRLEERLRAGPGRTLGWTAGGHRRQSTDANRAAPATYSILLPNVAATPRRPFWQVPLR